MKDFERNVQEHKAEIVLRNVLLGCSKIPSSDCQQRFQAGISVRM